MKSRDLLEFCRDQNSIQTWLHPKKILPLGETQQPDVVKREGDIWISTFHNKSRFTNVSHEAKKNVK